MVICKAGSEQDRLAEDATDDKIAVAKIRKC